MKGKGIFETSEMQESLNYGCNVIDLRSCISTAAVCPLAVT